MTMDAPAPARSRTRLLLAALFIVYGVLVLEAARWNSPTVDEPNHIRSGMGQLYRGTTVDPQAEWRTAVDPLHPPSDMIPAALARLAGQSPDFIHHPEVTWQAIRAARWFNHLLGALLLGLVFVWGRRLWGEAGGWLAAALLLCNPLFLGHSAIVSTDLTMAAGGVAAAYALWRAWLETPARLDRCNRAFWLTALAVGGVLGLAVALKVSNLLFLGLAPVATCWAAGRHRGRLGRALLAAAVIDAVALGLAIAIYGWGGDLHQGPVSIAGHPWPLPVGENLARSALQALRLGELLHSPIYYKGWIEAPRARHYLGAFVYKTPLILQVLLAAGGALAAWLAVRRRSRGLALLVALAALLPLWFATRGFYQGLRHMLLPIALLTVLAGSLATAAAGRRWPRALLWGLVALSGFTILQAAPWYLGYFNALTRGRLVLIDSDGDWGQGLIALARWQAQHSPDAPIWLAYFGNARPEDYGVRYRGLLSPYSPTRLDPDYALGRDPAQVHGWVALSASQLAGRFMWSVDRDASYYERWRALQPDVKLAGGTIYLYRRP